MDISPKQQMLIIRSIRRSIVANDQELKHSEELGLLLRTPEFIKQVKEETKQFRELLKFVKK